MKNEFVGKTKTGEILNFNLITQNEKIFALRCTNKGIEAHLVFFLNTKSKVNELYIAEVDANPRGCGIGTAILGIFFECVPMIEAKFNIHIDQAFGALTFDDIDAYEGSSDVSNLMTFYEDVLAVNKIEDVSIKFYDSKNQDIECRRDDVQNIGSFKYLF